MAVNETTRLNLYTWSAGTDPFTRAQMNLSHEALEDRAGIFLSGSGAPSETAAAANDRAFYIDEDTNTLYFRGWSGASETWIQLGSASTPAALDPSTAAAAGTAAGLSRADHVHDLPNWGVVTDIESISTTKSAGIDSLFARADHVHDIAANAVGSSQIAADAVTASEIAADAVTTAKILDSNVTANKLASNAVTETKIANDAVTSAKIATSVAGDGITGGGGTPLAVNAGSGLEISSDAVRIAAAAAGNGLSGGAGSALAVNVDDSTIEINADSLRVKASGITSSHIADGTITNADISASAAIDVSKLNSNVLSRTNHTGTQTSSTISDFTEAVQDVIGAQTGLGGTGLTFTYTDGSNTIALAANLDNSTVEVDGSDNIRVKDSGITLAKLASAVQQLLVPTGAIVPYAGSTAPTGWLLCDGATYTWAQYSDLRALVGTTFGGVTNTNWKVPDLRGRVAVGMDNLGGTQASRINGVISNGLGQGGGHQYLQQHNHPASDTGHYHSNNRYMWVAAETSYLAYSAINDDYVSGGNSPHYFYLDNDVDTGYAQISVANNGSGSGQNVQPSLVLGYIIKT